MGGCEMGGRAGRRTGRHASTAALQPPSFHIGSLFHLPQPTYQPTNHSQLHPPPHPTPFADDISMDVANSTTLLFDPFPPPEDLSIYPNATSSGKRRQTITVVALGSVPRPEAKPLEAAPAAVPSPPPSPPHSPPAPPADDPFKPSECPAALSASPFLKAHSFLLSSSLCGAGGRGVVQRCGLTCTWLPWISVPAPAA